MVRYTIPGTKKASADKVIAVHTMLDPQVDAVRVMADETALRTEPASTERSAARRAAR